MKRLENKKGFFAKNFELITNYISENYKFLLLFFFGFIALATITLLKQTTSLSVEGFDITEYEIGQISDKTIIAKTNLAPTGLDPVSVVSGEKVIKKGFPITEEAYAKLKKMSVSSLVVDYREFSNNLLFLFLVCLAWYILYSFMKLNKNFKISEPLLQVIFFLLIFTVTTFASRYPQFNDSFAICIIIPVSLCVMLLTILYGELSAILFSFINCFSVIVATGWQLPPSLFLLGSSLCAIAIVKKIERRIDLIFSSVALAAFNLVLSFFLMVIFNEDLSNKTFVFVGIVCNGLLSGILTLGLLTPLEYMLNTASVFRLMDLSDLNAPLMQKMLLSASGTYNHSMMVAQLAENACREIGANPLVARVGAYYHDIGKIENPEYFVENQKGENKHNEINPSLSASVIKSHVRKGVEKAHHLHLPQAVINIISEHHGNSVIAYFYNEAQKKDSSVSPEDFSYPGNPPSSKESAVVMLADTVEAACRTLENPSVSRLEKFITQLISAKVEHNQLDNCDLTFKDIATIKDAFVQLLAGYYHSRIEYPDQQDPENKETNKDNSKENKDAKKSE